MQKQTLLITGASSGIGYETAKIAIQRGHRVIASALNDDLLTSLPNGTALNVVMDICDTHSIERALTQIKSSGLELSTLINNAGYAQPGPIELVGDEQLRRQFDVNFFGTLSVTRAVLPLLRHHSSTGKQSRIITLSSMLGLISLPFQGAYSASKHALEAAFEALRMELVGSGIAISLIEPGWITTQFLKTSMALAPKEWLEHDVYGAPLSTYFGISSEAESDNPTGNAKIAAALAGTPQQVAEVVMKALEADFPKARYAVTSMAKWMPILAALLPSRVWDQIQTKQYAKQ